MYNAFASKDEPGSKGSTRLNMDMADAVNIMQYAEKTPEGKPYNTACYVSGSSGKVVAKYRKVHLPGTFEVIYYSNCILYDKK